MIFCFSTNNRIPTPIYDARRNPSWDTINSIPISCYIPSDDDRAALEADICSIIGRRLQKYMPMFAKTAQIEANAHQYTDESATKSTNVSERNASFAEKLELEKGT